MAERFVLRLSDPQSNSWGYCQSGLTECVGQVGLFLKQSTFATREEAVAYINVLLESGWYRKEIKPEHFTVIPVYSLSCFGSFYAAGDEASDVHSLKEDYDV